METQTGESLTPSFSMVLQAHSCSKNSKQEVGQLDQSMSWGTAVLPWLQHGETWKAFTAVIENSSQFLWVNQKLGGLRLKRQVLLWMNRKPTQINTEWETEKKSPFYAGNSRPDSSWLNFIILNEELGAREVRAEGSQIEGQVGLHSKSLTHKQTNKAWRGRRRKMGTNNLKQSPWALLKP